jgi:chorismate mutase-like protein
MVSLHTQDQRPVRCQASDGGREPGISDGPQLASRAGRILVAATVRVCNGAQIAIAQLTTQVIEVVIDTIALSRPTITQIQEDFMTSLPDFRAHIDALDTQIIRALADRLSVCREVAVFKKAHGIPMMQPGRVEVVKERAAAAAVAAGLNRAFILQLYSLIIDEACRIEDDLMQERVVTNGSDLRSAD